MSTITVTLADDDLAFLRRFSQAQGISAEEILARQARSLRRQLERPLTSDVVAASGIFAVNAEPRQAFTEYQERKHQ
jgi:hypothetical protein